MPQTSRSRFAIKQIDRLTGRVFTIASLATSAEAFFNSLNQHDILNMFWFYAAFGLIVASQIANAINFWFLGAARSGYLIQGASYLAALATWPLQVAASTELPFEHKPWLWWATGSAAIAMGMFLPKWWAFVYLAFVPTSWAFVYASPLGGSASFANWLTDACYVTLFPATLVTLLQLLRSAAQKVDLAYDEALSAQMVRVASETEVLEQTRLDSILYANVFEALKFAAKAKNSAEYELAVETSKEGLARIESSRLPQSEEVSTMSLFSSLEEVSRRIDGACELSITGSSLTFIPKDVAAALSDATVQALTNSVQHAGMKAKRKVRLKGTKRGVKLVISDNGLGFRPSKVPDQSLGFRFVIIRRVESVGGRVRIESEPSKGTTIVLEWEAES